MTQLFPIFLMTGESIADKARFRELYELYYKRLCHFGLRYVREIETAEDIVHEVFINLWEKRETIDPEKSVKAYLFRSVANRCLNYIRDHKKFDTEKETGAIETEEISEHQMLEQEELENRIERVIESLPDRCRQIFKMNRFEEKKYREIADELGISIKTVEIQISKALKVLRVNLKDYLKILVIMFVKWLF
ncbi:MAG: RNA polymerase sigma-70 factor [Bacteroidales bacterium]|nr:RNA polymerase sigma-70 factor [Bacteroidales bacterium]